MSVWDFDSLNEHAGHSIMIQRYGDEKTGIVNVAIECLDCNSVLVSYDKEPEQDGKNLYQVFFSCNYGPSIKVRANSAEEALKLAYDLYGEKDFNAFTMHGDFFAKEAKKIEEA